jgi:predicted nucleotidyltransferase
VADDYFFRKLPRATQGRLEELIREIKQAWGSSLSSVILFGSVARGEWAQGRSDVDVVLVAKQLTPKELASAAEAIAVAQAAIRLDALLLEEAEIPRSADVSPLLFRDICEHRIVIAGADVFASVVVREEHVDLAIEQELRDSLRGLRRALIDARDDEALIALRVEAYLRKIRIPLRALLRAEGIEVGHALSLVVAKAARNFRLDSTVLERARERPVRACEELLELCSRAIALADSRNAKNSAGAVE